MFQTFLIQPIYNAFVLLLGVSPGGDMGLAIIALTILMRAILYPVFTSSIKTQMGMQAMQAELDQVTKQYEKNKEKLAEVRLELARKYKVNPLSMLGALVLQFGLIIGLYIALFREGFPHIDTQLLYSFVHAPATVSTNFFGIIDLITPHHILLAFLVAVTQYVAIKLTLKRSAPSSTSSAHAAQKMQQNMMLYVMPALIAVVSYSFPGAVGLYFATSNIVSVGQEWLIRRHVL